MDHLEAVRLRAAERYVLKQLNVAEAEAFEEHFFSCPECAEEVRWIAMFEDNARKAVKAREMSAAFAVVFSLEPGQESEVTIPEHVRQVVLELRRAAAPPPDAEVSFVSASGAIRFSLPLPEGIVGPVHVSLKASDLDPGPHKLRLGDEEFPVMIRIG
jgi:anti-sigma factor RsiW